MARAPHPQIGLASGVLPEFGAEITVEAAARAGFNAVGLWIVPGEWPLQRVRAVRTAIRANDLSAIDIEVLRMRPGPLSDDHHRMVELTAELGAANLLVVGGEGEAAAFAEPYAQLCEVGEAHGVRIALEFMLFSGVPTLDAARQIVAAAKSPAAALLIDPLHLDRAGYLPADVASLPPEWLSYAQLCDAPAGTIARDDLVGLLDEARNGRSLPGQGVLPIGAILAALPRGIPLSIELRSQALRDAYPDPVDRATAVRTATLRWLQRDVAA